VSEARERPQIGEAEEILRFIPTPEVIFDLERAGPSVLARAAETADWLPSALSDLRSRLPIARSAQPFDAGSWFRPASHRRAFYRRCPGPAVIAFKGTELLAEDAAGIVAWVHAKHDLLDSPLEQFPIQEHKAPGVLLTEEAIGEAQSALAFHSRWIEVYEGLARTPVPMLVVAWPGETIARYRDQMAPFLSARVKGILGRLLADGLAAYVYFYPGLPTRATELGDRDSLKMLGYAGRREELGAELSIERTFRSWMDLVGRMLAIGFMPVTLSHDRAGQMVQMQNAAADGGFMDMDSVQPLSRIADIREMITSFYRMLGDLALTTGTLFGGNDSRRMDGLPLVQRDAAILAVHEALASVLRREEARGLAIDPRLKEVVFPETPFSRLDRLYGAHYP
jgi:hypothetical protein